MSMYVDMLSLALDGWESELSGEALVDYVLDCRRRLLVSGIGMSEDADVSLAAELAYDRALILLCRDLGMEVGPAGFTNPDNGRTRVEAMALAAGVDLASLSNARARNARATKDRTRKDRTNGSPSPRDKGPSGGTASSRRSA